MIIEGVMAGRVERKKEKEKWGSCVSFYSMCYLKEIKAKYFRSHSVSLKKSYIFMVVILKDQALLLVCLPR